MHLEGSGIYPEMKVEEMKNHMDPGFSHLRYDAHENLQIGHADDHLIMIIHGEAYLHLHPGQSYRLPEGTLNLMRIGPEKKAVIGFNRESEMMHLHYPPEFVHTFMSGTAWPPTGQKALESDSQANLLFPNALPFSTEVTRIIRDLAHCPLEGYYLNLFVRAKAIEILAYLFHYRDLGPGRPDRSPEVLREEIRDRMAHVRDILHARMDKPLSIHSLAQLVGTNERYLKIHFKQMFGTTVFGYLHDLRMEKAKKMLLEEQKTIAEIARHLGYRHASHFSTVFKRHYGMSPSKVMG